MDRSLKKICFVTSTRADYGLLRYLIKEVKSSTEFELQIIATGMHLTREYGSTLKEIQDDGFRINKKIDSLLSSDTPEAATKSIGLSLVSFSDALNDLKPDLIIVLGDRYELLSVATAALLYKIPIAHIHGGETTEGAIDESIRHSITKMSWWHFVATDIYRKRVIQLGENSNRVFNVGGLGVDAIKKSKLLSRKKLEKKLNFKFKEKNLLVTFHPVTLENNTSAKQFKAVLDALNEFKDIFIIFTMPNADPNNKIIKQMIEEFIAMNTDRAIEFVSMGQLKYYSTMQFVDGVLGNSSSGLLEAPSFKIGSINIGDRQKGRLKAKSIIDCKPSKNSIAEAIEILYSDKFNSVLSSTINPYGDGKAVKKIMNVLSKKSIPKELKKEFNNI